MPDREKVIKGLETCGISGTREDCEGYGCPYFVYNDEVSDECIVHLFEDAIALLKAQEPRVMTLEEVNALDWDYCYLEQERLQGKEYRWILGKYMLTCVTWPSITEAKILHGKGNYGRTWRCWTSRPTEEQKEATPWEP